MAGGRRAIPDRWLDYKPIGNPIKGTPFIAFKVPLTPEVNQTVDRRDTRLDPVRLLEKVPNLGLIIDLTNTNRYYDPRYFERNGIQHVKMMLPGRQIPDWKQIEGFTRLVREFVRDEKNHGKLIGVHCTHGVNRTGYLVCHNMITELDMPPAHAIRLFEDARGHAIERDIYRNGLHRLGVTKIRNSSIVLLEPPAPPSWRVSSEISRGEMAKEKDVRNRSVPGVLKSIASRHADKSTPQRSDNVGWRARKDDGRKRIEQLPVKKIHLEVHAPDVTRYDRKAHEERKDVAQKIFSEKRGKSRDKCEDIRTPKNVDRRVERERSHEKQLLAHREPKLDSAPQSRHDQRRKNIATDDRERDRIPIRVSSVMSRYEPKVLPVERNLALDDKYKRTENWRERDHPSKPISWRRNAVVERHTLVRDRSITDRETLLREERRREISAGRREDSRRNVVERELNLKSRREEHIPEQDMRRRPDNENDVNAAVVDDYRSRSRERFPRDRHLEFHSRSSHISRPDESSEYDLADKRQVMKNFGVKVARGGEREVYHEDEELRREGRRYMDGVVRDDRIAREVDNRRRDLISPRVEMTPKRITDISPDRNERYDRRNLYHGDGDREDYYVSDQYEDRAVDVTAKHREAEYSMRGIDVRDKRPMYEDGNARRNNQAFVLNSPSRRDPRAGHELERHRSTEDYQERPNDGYNIRTRDTGLDSEQLYRSRNLPRGNYDAPRRNFEVRESPGYVEARRPDLIDRGFELDGVARHLDFDRSPRNRNLEFDREVRNRDIDFIHDVRNEDPVPRVRVDSPFMQYEDEDELRRHTEEEILKREREEFLRREQEEVLRHQKEELLRREEEVLMRRERELIEMEERRRQHLRNEMPIDFDPRRMRDVRPITDRNSTFASVVRRGLEEHEEEERRFKREREEHSPRDFELEDRIGDFTASPSKESKGRASFRGRSSRRRGTVLRSQRRGGRIRR